MGSINLGKLENFRLTFSKREEIKKQTLQDPKSCLVKPIGEIDENLHRIALGLMNHEEIRALLALGIEPFDITRIELRWIFFFQKDFQSRLCETALYNLLAPFANMEQRY